MEIYIINGKKESGKGISTRHFRTVTVFMVRPVAALSARRVIRIGKETKRDHSSSVFIR
jgi:hypothetical protein